MLIDPTTFDIAELARVAKVTTRTVRYYVAQGLLPQPGSRGPGTRYDVGHLDRLQLIKRLQREHLPLAEIRRRLEAMDDAAVREAMLESPAVKPSPALSYVHKVLGQAEPRPRRVAAPSLFAPSETAESRLDRTISEPEPPLWRRPERTSWERIVLGPDIELHIRRPLTRDENRKVERIIDAARHLLEEES
jgi:DNA-binding transcriptional MerR regulator